MAEKAFILIETVVGRNKEVVTALKQLSKPGQQPKLWLTESRIGSCQLTYAFLNSDNYFAPIIPPRRTVFAF